MTRAIDCLVNVDMGDAKQPEWMIRVKEDYFKGGESFFKSPELSELLDDMDANGVSRAILLTSLAKSGDRAQRPTRSGSPSFDYYKVSMPSWAAALAATPLSSSEAAAAQVLKNL